MSCHFVATDVLLDYDSLLDALQKIIRMSITCKKTTLPQKTQKRNERIIFLTASAWSTTEPPRLKTLASPGSISLSL